jgi:cobalt-precorrin-7 (C5)-methyltransferase
MAVNRSRIAIVGCGPGAAEYLTDAARHAVQAADVLVGSRRLLELFPEHAGQRLTVDSHIKPLLDKLDEIWQTGRSLAVLVSGDPGLCSLAGRVLGRFGRENCRVIPAVSSVQAAFACLGLSWEDARIVSAHGRSPQIALKELAEEGKVAILAGTREAVLWAAEVCRSLRETHAAYLCENLTLPDERIREATPEVLAGEVASLAIVLVVRRSLL